MPCDLRRPAECTVGNLGGKHVFFVSTAQCFAGLLFSNPINVTVAAAVPVGEAEAYSAQAQNAAVLVNVTAQLLASMPG